MKSVIEKSLNFNKRIKVNFDGGNLTSDSINGEFPLKN